MIAAVTALAGVVIVSVAAQVLLKLGASRLVTGRGLAPLVRSVNTPLVLAAISFFIAPPLYFFALTRLELGFAFYSTALAQGGVAIASRYVFGERVKRANIAGLMLIVLGLLIWHL